MRRKLRTALLGCVAGAGLAACSDQPSAVPTIPRTIRVNADVLPTCNINGLKAAVRNYVAASNDPIYDIIRDLSQATSSAAAYDAGMNGLARLALVRGSVDPVLKKTGATAAQGAAAVTGFLACMPVGNVQDGFATNIVSAMGAGGLFEVPVGSGPIFTRGAGTPFWFAQPKAGTWFGLTGKRVMIFGYQIGNYDGNNDPTAGGGFDYNIVPMLTAGQQFPTNNSLLVGVCGDGAISNVRLKHNSTILPEETIVCPASSPPLASVSARNGLDFAAIARKSVGFFLPEPLHAAAFAGITAGGSVSELSPTVPVVVNAALSFQSQPVDGPIKQTLKGSDGTSVKVLVQTTANTPLNNAVVTLEITGNSGLNALFKDPTLPGNGTAIKVTRATNSSGIADFDGIFVTKAGGYTLTATVVWDGEISATPIISNLFNMKNK
jgi:hypothetical protein